MAINSSGVWWILKKVGLNRLPASQRYKRRSTRWKWYEKQRPGHQLQVDVSARLNGKVERSHRIDSEGVLPSPGQVIDGVNLFSTKLQGWEDYYN